MTERKSQTFFAKEGGEWADSSSLEMGVGSKGKTLYYECPNCFAIHTINQKTAGLICNGCKTYIIISKSNIVTNVIDDASGKSFWIPNKELLKFRGKMENKAENWMNKQEQKKKQPGYVPTYHGPIDPATGKHTK